MKKVIFALSVICGLSFSFVSCKLDDVSASSVSASSSDDALSDFTALAAADTIKSNGKGHGKGHGKDQGDTTKRVKLTEIDIATLPATITTYITTNYAGSTIKKAAQNADKSKTFVGISKADGTKAILEFDATGAFVNERTGKGHMKGTKIEVSALPAAITTYITTNYAGSTINKAIKTPNGYFVDVKKADGTYIGLAFNADGTFNKEVTIKGKK